MVGPGGSLAVAMSSATVPEDTHPKSPIVSFCPGNKSSSVLPSLMPGKDNVIPRNDDGDPSKVFSKGKAENFSVWKARDSKVNVLVLGGLLMSKSC
jgi:hypothetical protein